MTDEEVLEKLSSCKPWEDELLVIENPLLPCRGGPEWDKLRDRGSWEPILFTWPVIFDPVNLLGKEDEKG